MMWHRRSALPTEFRRRVYMSCGAYVYWDLATFHYLECEECDRVDKARNFTVTRDDAPRPPDRG